MNLVPTENLTWKQSSFKIIAIINAIFFSGYFIIKCPLAYILQASGVEQISSYSLAATANIIFASCSLVFGFSLRNFKTQKIAMVIGVLFSTISIGLLSIGGYFLTKIAITFYILGGSLYFFSITLLINKQFDNSTERLKGNFVYQIFVNFGGFVGELFFFVELNINHQHLFLYAGMACLFSLILLLYQMKNIVDDATCPAGMKRFVATMILLFGVIYLTLQYESEIRALTVIFFVLAILYIFYAAKIKQHYALARFMGLIFLFSVPYWMAYSFMYNEFFDFLSKDVSVIFGLSGSTLLLLNPVINILFGILTLTPLFSQRLSSYQYLNMGLFLIFCAFLIVTIAIKQSSHILNPLYPAIAIILYSMAEFLIQSTLNSNVSDLLKTSEDQILGLGMLRSSRSFSAAIAYYFMTYHEIAPITHYSARTEMQVAYYTYALFSVVLGVMFLLAITQAKKLIHRF